MCVMCTTVVYMYDVFVLVFRDTKNIFESEPVSVRVLGRSWIGH